MLDFSGFQAQAVPMKPFFANGRPSDHLPIVCKKLQSDKPLLETIPRSFASSLEWKMKMIAEHTLKIAKFDEIPLEQAVPLLPVLLQRAARDYRHDLS